MTRPSIDDILTGVELQQEEISLEPETKEPVSEVEKENNEEKNSIEKIESEKPEESQTSIKNSDDKIAKEQDEYGNETRKSKMYSEEDVQRMIRDRLSRGQNTHTNHHNAHVQEAAQNFRVDPNNVEDWEVQLEGFIKNTINKVTKETELKSFQQREIQKQSDFESKFTTGMEKYADFREIVGNVPITDSMMMASRDMKDPAAFIYAAAKTQGDEIRRISNLNDPYQQAVEIGRLEERMKKTANITRTSKPLGTTVGDISTKETPKYSIDSRIHQYGKQKIR